MALPKPILLRIILIAVILFVLLVTLIGHFGSDWTHRDKNYASLHKMYYMCTNLHYSDSDYSSDCPPISMEQFYVAMLVLCLLLAIGSTLLVHFNKNENKWLRLVDFILQVLFGFLLLIGVITFLASTAQVKEIFDTLNESGRNRREYDEWGQWIIKIIAGLLGLGVVVFHAFLAYLIGKPLFEEFKQGRVGDAEEGAASQSSVQASSSKQGADFKSRLSKQSQKV